MTHGEIWYDAPTWNTFGTCNVSVTAWSWTIGVNGGGTFVKCALPESSSVPECE